MRAPGPSPARRVRERLRSELGERALSTLPSGYQRLGRVLVLQIPEELRPHFGAIGHAWCSELGVETVLRRAGEAQGELRIPQFERIIGQDATTEVVEYGVRFRFDAQRIMFARGNRAERHRMATEVAEGERVADLFAGIGYFALPIAVAGRAREVWAVEKNPESFRFLEENVRRNRVSSRVRVVRGDNRSVDLPRGRFTRVVLGYLPSSLPWIERSLELLSSRGGTVHAHLVVGHREGKGAAEELVRRAAEAAGGRVHDVRGRTVKAYGPGREHVVVDLSVEPSGRNST